MNLFEGGRRIALILAVIGLICGLIGIYNTEPYIVINYQLNKFGGELVRTDECSPKAGNHYVDHTTPKGRKFRIRACFPRYRADNGKMLIPYEHSKVLDRVFMDDEYSDEVERYMRFVSEVMFKPTALDFEDADSQFLRQSITKRLEGFGWLAVGLACFWGFISVLGWIVRGFAGIPSGHDRKPIAPPST